MMYFSNTIQKEFYGSVEVIRIGTPVRIRNLSRVHPLTVRVQWAVSVVKISVRLIIKP